MNKASPSLQAPGGWSPSRAGSPHAALLQRKCACGTATSSMTGECADCNGKRLQAKLSIGARNDPLESEADRVAAQIPTVPARTEALGSAAQIQRFTKQMPAQEGVAAPPGVEHALSSPGKPLDRALRQDMEQRFDHDFSRVRVHTGAAAERSAREINARAYTMGHDIVFGEGQFSPSLTSGRRLLAHELTHVVQQSAGASEASTVRAKPKKGAPPKKDEICGRPSRKVPGNSITKVNLDVGTNELTIEWKDPTKIPPGSAGTHAISPGSGLCCVDCDDETVSQKSGSLCTPKGGVWPVDDTGCALAGHPTAKNPTYFQRRGVAIHSGNTSSPPQSHGCARTSLEISELIHDNVVRKVTEIASSGAWASSKCYLDESSKTLSNRKDVCDGNKLKSRSKGKKQGEKARPHGQPNAPTEIPAEKTPPKAPAPVPVAEVSGDSDEFETGEVMKPGMEGLPEMAVDGPGPNNESLSHESIGEVQAELDSAEQSAEDDVGT
jgi:hypothetical protein